MTNDTESSLLNMYADTAESIVKNTININKLDNKNKELTVINKTMSSSSKKISKIEEHINILKNTIQSQNNKIITLERLIKQLEQKINSLELYTNRY